MTDPFVQNLQETVFSKPSELGSWNFERMFTPTICHMSCTRCDLSCFLLLLCFFDKVVELVGGGSVIKEAYLPCLVSMSPDLYKRVPVYSDRNAQYRFEHMEL